MLPRHLPQAARPDWGGTPVSRRLKLPKQAMSPVPLVRLVLLASPALSVPPGGSFASSDPKRIAAGRAQRRLVFRILLAAWLPPAVVLVRQPQPGIAARTVASWPDRWAASAERLVRAAQLAWVVRHTLLARAAQTVWAVWAAQTAQTAQTAGTAEPVWLVPWVLCYMLPSLARESEEPLA